MLDVWVPHVIGTEQFCWWVPLEISVWCPFFPRAQGHRSEPMGLGASLPAQRAPRSTLWGHQVLEAASCDRTILCLDTSGLCNYLRWCIGFLELPAKCLIDTPVKDGTHGKHCELGDPAKMVSFLLASLQNQPQEVPSTKRQRPISF